MSLDTAQIAALFTRPTAVQDNQLLRIRNATDTQPPSTTSPPAAGKPSSRSPSAAASPASSPCCPSAAPGRVLVIAPNLTIREQLVEAFTPGDPKCFYTPQGVLTDLSDGPYVAVAGRRANASDLDDCARRRSPTSSSSPSGGRWLPDLPEDYFDLIIVDEGHHNAAPSWQDVFDRFPDAKIISLTATPFRADDQPVEGEVIYRYPIAEAMRRGYIKHIQSSQRRAQRAALQLPRGRDSMHTLEEVLDAAGEGLVLQRRRARRACNVSIVDASIQWLRAPARERAASSTRSSPSPARSTTPAAIRGLYEERGYTPARSTRTCREDEQEAESWRPRATATLDVIVQVQMLGEGFDHPPLSVAAVFRPYRSLNPYIQFVGRVMRVNVQNAPGHPDNRGIVVSHVGLNIDQHWDDFKALDDEDQDLVHDWLTAPPGPPPIPTGHRPPLRPAMHVTHERISDQFLGDRFLDVAVDDLPDRVLEILRANGVDPAAAGLDRSILETLTDLSRPAEPTGPVTQLVGPQARRMVSAITLNDKIKSISLRICSAAGLVQPADASAGWPPSRAENDLVVTITLMNQAVNAHVASHRAGAATSRSSNSSRHTPTWKRSPTRCRPKSWGGRADAENAEPPATSRGSVGGKAVPMQPQQAPRDPPRRTSAGREGPGRNGEKGYCAACAADMLAAARLLLDQVQSRLAAAAQPADAATTSRS